MRTLRRPVHYEQHAALSERYVIEMKFSIYMGSHTGRISSKRTVCDFASHEYRAKLQVVRHDKVTTRRTAIQHSSYSMSKHLSEAMFYNMNEGWISLL